MVRRFSTPLSLLVAAVALTACGSSKSSSSANSSRSTSTGTTAKANLTIINRRPPVHRGAKPHLSGLQGLSLQQKLQVFSTSAGKFWVAEFNAAKSQISNPTVNIIGQAPATCGSNQVTTTDPPEYCLQDQSVDLPVSFISSNVAPVGDAAVLLVVSDLYGYHVENTIGAFSSSAGLSGATLEEMDSCFSGVYFQGIQQYLTPGDEQAVNKVLAAKAAASGTSASGGAVTASQLSTAFNKGFLSKGGDFTVCFPQSSGGGSSTGTTT